MIKKPVFVWLGGMATLLLGLVLGRWLDGSGTTVGKDESATGILSVHRLRLTDDQGRIRAELKADGPETSLVFLDDSKRERLTLALGKAGVVIAIDGHNSANKMILSINDSLNTSSIFLSSDTSAINLVGSEDAQLKISNSLRTDARSTSLGVAGPVTKLRLSTDGSEAQLFTKDEEEDEKGGARPSKVVELNMRTGINPDIRLRLSSDAKPSIQMPTTDNKRGSKLH